jgi:hypothetical protein
LRIKRETAHLRGKTFPRLRALHFEKCPSIVSLEPAEPNAATAVLRPVDQPSLPRHYVIVIRISSLLGSLSCPLHDGLLACLGAPEQPLRRLRSLRLQYNRSANVQRATRRLARLLGGNAAQGAPCRALERASFYNVFDGDTVSAGRVFSLCARRPALREFSMTDFHVFRLTPVPHADDDDDDDDDDGTREDDADGGGNGIAVAASSSARPPSAALLAPLKALEISIASASMPRLTNTFPALTRLVVAAVTPDAAEMATMAPGFFAAIGSLTALRMLNVRLSFRAVVTAADVRQLQHLRQLRQLTLGMFIGAPDLAPAEVLQLLRCLGHLTTLTLLVDWEPPPETLDVLGAACPQLRSVELWGDLNLAQAFDMLVWQAQQPGQQPTPLFANLEALRVSEFVYAGEDRNVR